MKRLVQHASVKTVRKDAAALKFAPDKTRPEELEKLGRSLDQFGYVEPIVWNKRTGNVVGGNHGLAVLLKRGVKSVDVVEVDLPYDCEKVLGIALNRIHGEFDLKVLTELLQAMPPPERLLALDRTSRTLRSLFPLLHPDKPRVGLESAS
jgi:ParB-like chromosome segregation protein Spo0J